MPASPATAPVTATPVGQVVAAPPGVALAFDTQSRTLAAVTQNEVLLYSVDGGLRQKAAVPLDTHAPGRAVVATGGGFLVAAKGAIIRITADGAARVTDVDGDALTAVPYQGKNGVDTLVGLADGRIEELGGKTPRTISGLVEASRLLVHGEDVLAVDRRQATLTVVDTTAGKLGDALRVGRGITNAEIDPYGRVVAVDTGHNQIIGFTASPFMERFLYPVPGAPYAVDYDDAAKLAWVTTTGTNQVVGYALSSGEPVEKQRKATVAEPDAVAVDPRDGTVFVLSAAGGGVQAIPTR
ncbi:lipoprotein [Tsukamurella soli]|uniref:Lipoprotein n=1 Tax=Tsukamurella soli TaxID=644556 RepID=A0ABP8JNL3_9ACTN